MPSAVNLAPAIMLKVLRYPGVEHWNSFRSGPDQGLASTRQALSPPQCMSEGSH